jgi:hypothetical protein
MTALFPVLDRLALSLIRFDVEALNIRPLEKAFPKKSARLIANRRGTTYFDASICTPHSIGLLCTSGLPFLLSLVSLWCWA